MRLFEAYLKELYDNAYVSHDENGFVVYWIDENKGHLFIQDMYVSPEVRSYEGTKPYIERVEDEARQRGCSVATCNIDLKSKVVEENLISFIRYGFKVVSAQNENILLLKKEL